VQAGGPAPVEILEDRRRAAQLKLIGAQSELERVERQLVALDDPTPPAVAAERVKSLRELCPR